MKCKWFFETERFRERQLPHVPHFGIEKRQKNVNKWRKSNFHVFRQNLLFCIKMPLSGIRLPSLAMQMQKSVTFITFRMRSTNIARTLTPAQQRPKKPVPPYMRFINERRKGAMAEVHKETTERWKVISEEEKRPFVEKCEAAKENSLSELAVIKAQLEAMKEVEKRWADLSLEERVAYTPSEMKIYDKGQHELLALTLEKMKTMKARNPKSSLMQFRNQVMSERLPQMHKEFKREWAELSDKEKEAYRKTYEAELKCYNAQMEEYKAGSKYLQNERNIMSIKGKIRQIEKEMNKPKLLALNSLWLFRLEKRETLIGKSGQNFCKTVAVMWQALSEEERMEYKAKWSKIKAKWQIEVAEWERRYTYNPKMAELKAYKTMLQTAGSHQHFTSKNMNRDAITLSS